MVPYAKEIFKKLKGFIMSKEKDMKKDWIQDRRDQAYKAWLKCARRTHFETNCLLPTRRQRIQRSSTNAYVCRTMETRRERVTT